LPQKCAPVSQEINASHGVAARNSDHEREARVYDEKHGGRSAAPGDRGTCLARCSETGGAKVRALRFVVIIFIGLIPAGSFQADTYQVTKIADTSDGVCDSDCSLREAVAAANARPGPDNVSVPAGTYLLTLGSLAALDDLSIWGAGQANTIIDGNAASRVVEIPVSGLFEISGVTIRNGYTAHGSDDPDGAGILLSVGRLTLSDSTVSGNWSGAPGYGGGISNQLGRLTINDSTISGNYAEEIAGGIWSRDGPVAISGSLISGNSALVGAGIFVYRGSLEMTDSVVMGNVASDSVGGVKTNYAFVTVSNSTVSGNTSALGPGGGIYSSLGILDIDGSTIAGNYTYDNGGGIYGDNIPITIVNSTISGNTAVGEGGGIFSGAASVTLTNSTVTENLATNYGGGIESFGTLNLESTIVAGNDASLGGWNCFSDATTSFGYNLTDDTSCGLTEMGDLVVGDAMLGPLADNGGPTETHALLPGSPAIDAGSAFCPPPAVDQRGVARPQGAGCDIGAVEFVPEPSSGLVLMGGIGLLTGLRFLRRARTLR